MLHAGVGRSTRSPTEIEETLNNKLREKIGCYIFVDLGPQGGVLLARGPPKIDFWQTNFCGDESSSGRPRPGPLFTYLIFLYKDHSF